MFSKHLLRMRYLVVALTATLACDLNVMNHPNFANPNTDISGTSGPFGVITATSSTANPCEFRFATRVFF